MQVIILGAGIVGLTIANLLSQDPRLEINLIDSSARDFIYDGSDYDIRCSAITYASQKIFDKIGVWSDIVKKRVAAYDKMIVWQENPQVNVHFAATNIGAENLGYIIENRIINTALYNKLLNKSNVKIISGMASGLYEHKDFIKITVDSKEVTGSLIIGADGANSWLRNAANIKAHRVDYNHAAIVACIESSLSHNYIARQRFMSEGPLAFLPLADPNYNSIVWSCKPDTVKELMALDDITFCDILSEKFCNVLGDLRLHSKRISFPLTMIHATDYVCPRIALIGDAAHVIHPLAGQGLNLGILDAQSLAECVFNAIVEQRDIGSFSVLRKYERSRKIHNLRMITLVGTLKHLFSYENRMMKNILNHGMYYLNGISSAKNFMMRFALGI